MDRAYLFGESGANFALLRNRGRRMSAVQFDRARRDGSGSPLLESIGAKLAEPRQSHLLSNMENGGDDDAEQPVF